jgi:hypothetical protein
VMLVLLLELFDVLLYHLRSASNEAGRRAGKSQVGRAGPSQERGTDRDLESDAAGHHQEARMSAGRTSSSATSTRILRALSGGHGELSGQRSACVEAEMLQGGAIFRES